MPRRAVSALIALSSLAGLAFAIGPSAVRAQGAGAFTAAQADRGMAAFVLTCAMCHGEDMSGGAGAPALSGPDFAFGWKGKPVQALFDKISTTMPPGQTGALTDQQYLDVVSAILRKNGVAPGSAELTPGSAGMKAVGLP